VAFHDVTSGMEGKFFVSRRKGGTGGGVVYPTDENSKVMSGAISLVSICSVL